MIYKITKLETGKCVVTKPWFPEIPDGESRQGEQGPKPEVRIEIANFDTLESAYAYIARIEIG